MWLKELMSYVDFPPLQVAASYNLSNRCSSRCKEMSKRTTRANSRSPSED